VYKTIVLYCTGTICYNMYYIVQHMYAISSNIYTMLANKCQPYIQHMSTTILFAVYDCDLRW